MYYPEGMKARVSPVQSIDPHRILAPTRTWTGNLRSTVQSSNHYTTAAHQEDEDDDDEKDDDTEDK